MDRDRRVGRRRVLAGIGAAAAGLGGAPTAAADRRTGGPRSDPRGAGSGAFWAGDVHEAMTWDACRTAGLDFGNAFTATANATAPDRWEPDYDPEAVADDVVPDWLPEGTEATVARVVEQLPQSYGHYHNPGLEVSAWGYTLDVGGFGNAPDNVERYADRAAGAEGRERYRNLGYALHFVGDVGQPLHTGEEFDQASNQWVHYSYEDGIARHWNELSGAFRGDGDAAPVEDPGDATRELARITHEHSAAVYELVAGNREWADDPETRRAVLAETRPCLRAAGRYARGIVEHVERGGSGDGDDDGGGLGWIDWL
jgi:hypothetical protein